MLGSAQPENKTIVVAEDEPKIAQVLVDYLSNAGFQSHWIDNGNDVVDYIKDQSPSLLLLDIMLPGKDGMTICRELRSFSEIPIVMITAKIEEIDRLLGLELGADDYICKPFSPREVVARIKAIMRRLEPRSLAHQPDHDDNDFVIDAERMLISYQGQMFNLTPKEYKLLTVFLSKRGRVFSRDFLLDQLDEDFRDVSDRAIDSHIKNLRKKIAVVLPNQTVIHSIYGIGYKLEV